jgi:glyoxylase-like metal-dependent hydrolase (beta-lactamase superfamily II)
MPRDPENGLRVAGGTVPSVPAEIRDVTEGVWIWRLEHPDWAPHEEWAPLVACTCFEAGGEVVLLDPLMPADDTDEIWARLDARPPSVVAILKPDHVRDVDRIVERYGARAYGPRLFFRHDIPRTELEPIVAGAGQELPGGLVPQHDGRSREETPMWVPERRALVFADGMTAPDGELRVWTTPWHELSVLPALRVLLELPFEHVIVSHGEPVHDRAAYERALELPPWSGS